jgi:4-carboxymuconolactone decarboxylase
VVPITSDLRAPAAPARLRALARDEVDPSALALYDAISSSRGGMPMSFRTYLNSPAAAAAIAAFGQHVRWDSPVDQRTLEIVCLRVAAVLEDRFMWVHHAVLAREAGLREAEIEALREPSPRMPDPADDLAVAFIDGVVRHAMTDATFAAYREATSPAQALEVALATAYYAMHHMLFSALGLDSATDTRVPLSEERPEHDQHDQQDRKAEA